MAPFWRKNQLVQTKEKRSREKAHDLENQDASHGPRHDLPQGFSLLQMGTNWFLGIWTLPDPKLGGPKDGCPKY
jgi:hypothetical protein